MVTLTITATAQDQDELQLALEEVSRLVDAGNTSGMNRNDTGSFSFELFRQAPPTPPARGNSGLAM